MKKITIYIAIAMTAAAIAAFTTEQIFEKKKIDSEILLGLLYQQSAGEYKALCLQAYNIARVQVDQAVLAHKTNLAIITDLDETALDNSQDEAYAFHRDSPYGPPQFREWWLTGKAGAVPGAVEFFRYAKEKGIDIYYISNRNAEPAVVASTMANMRVLGFPYTEDKYKDHFLFAPQIGTKNGNPLWASSKEPRRRKITEILKKDVILLLGDNLIDINTAFDKVNDSTYLSRAERWKRVSNFKQLWGKKYIVFPNAYYGDWERCLYDNKHISSGDFNTMNNIRDSILDTKNHSNAK